MNALDAELAPEATKPAPDTTRACGEGDAAAQFGAAGWLSLAAAPTFATMALLTSMSGDGMPAGLCAADASPLGGMVPMYLLMSAFHLAPWLRLISGRRSRIGRP